MLVIAQAVHHSVRYDHISEHHAVSVESMTVALHHSQAAGTAKLVLIGIANHDGDGGAWPSVNTLAKYAGVSRRNVQKALERLESLGEISIVRNGGGSHSLADSHRPNLYRVTVRCPPNCDRSTQHRTRRTVANLFEQPVDSGVSVATRGVGSDAGGVSVATPEPPYNPTINSERANHSTRACKEGHSELAYTPGYCKFGDRVREVVAA
jgi:DNA-binding transcriptional MocR family regulator